MDTDSAARRSWDALNPAEAGDRDRCVTCGEPAVVGFGNPPNWLCQEHFESRLKMAGDVIRTAMEALGE